VTVALDSAEGHPSAGETPTGLLLRGASQVLTMGGASGPRRGRDQGELGAVPGGVIATIDGRIVAVGSEADAARALRGVDADVIDVGGALIMPGFVDPHGHLLFAGSRPDDFESRQLSGRSFLESVQEGGGSLRTVAATRAANDDDLARLVRARIGRMLATGTTTVEIKSGYGLTVEEELRHLRVIQNIARQVPAHVVATALPAHFRPPESPDSVIEYVSAICSDLLPIIQAEKLATSVDVFCAPGAYSYAECEQILRTARALGLGCRVHADQLSDDSGAVLAASVGALSADHLGAISRAGIEALASSNTVAVLIPGSLFLAPGEMPPPARELIHAGVPIAISTDFNPGSSPMSSQSLTVSMACVLFHLTVAEALVAATINAAYALDRGQDAGSLEVGKCADVLVIEAADHRDIAYRFGENLVRTVIVDGRVVAQRPEIGVL
jgi:imidazolonepropionase